MSSAKRCRVMRSPSLADAVLEKPYPPSAPSPQVFCRHIRMALPFSSISRPRSETAQSFRGILSLSTPASEEPCEKQQIGYFLKSCYYCRKTMTEHDEVFMYGYLRAFCTSECREEQILKDKLLEKMSGLSSKRNAARC